MHKYIRLYEDYTKLDKKNSISHHSWQEIRDIIQGKLPFIIIDFKNKEDAKKCIDEEIFDESHSKQMYFSKNEQGESVKFPSIFIFAEGSSDLKERSMDFHKRFDIERLIIGEYGKNDPLLYIDGEAVDIGSNLYSSNNIDDMAGGDFYRAGSIFYKFID